MPNIGVGNIVKILDNDGFWEVKVIINKRCALKQVDGECYRTANIGLLILVEKKNQHAGKGGDGKFFFRY